MQINSIIETFMSPSFTSRNRVGQDNTNKIYENQIISSQTGANDIPASKMLLSQKFDFHEVKTNEVSPENKTYDSFTGLRDKNYLLAFLNVAMQKAQRDDIPLSIAMFDMDNFKSVNELLSYEIGDIFIKEISKHISEIAKRNCVDAYRFGGEEFIIVFDNQTESEKKEIARNITQKINNNTIIQSYRSEYIRNAHSRLDKSAYSTSKVQKISALKTKKETLEEVYASLTTKEAKNDPYFKSAIDKYSIEIKHAYLNLISECLRKEKDNNIRVLLTTIKSKLISNANLLDTEQTLLDEYLYSVYDKASEIYQTKKWMSDYEQNNGFGITCGVVNFAPESLEYKSPMDIIDKAGKLLKKGKTNKKGQIYFEDINF